MAAWYRAGVPGHADGGGGGSAAVREEGCSGEVVIAEALECVPAARLRCHVAADLFGREDALVARVDEHHHRVADVRGGARDEAAWRILRLGSWLVIACHLPILPPGVPRARDPAPQNRGVTREAVLRPSDRCHTLRHEHPASEPQAA